MRSWSEEWDETWLSRRDSVQRFDGWVRLQMVLHHTRAKRTAAMESVGPWTVDTLVVDIDRFARNQDWLYATASICLLQELLFCAKDGGIRTSRSVPGAVSDEVTTLRTLRNAVLHPVNLAPTHHEEGPALEQLCFRMDLDPEFADFAVELMGDWSFLAQRPVTVFALRRLHSAGREYARHLWPGETQSGSS